MKKTFRAPVVLLLCILLAAPATAGDKLTLMLDWFPNVDHLPIYVAQEAGYFADQGIDVEIISPSDTADGLKLAAAGTVDLAVSYEPQSVIAAAEGLEIRVVGRLVEHPLTTLLFLKEKGIQIPSDLAGKKIGYTVPGLMDVMLAAFAKVNGITDYSAVNVGFAIVPALVSGQVDAVMGPFKTYETVTMRHKGIAAAYFELEKYGIPDYDELVFVSGKKMLSKKSAAIKAFIEAVGRGIVHVQADPKQALAMYFKALPDADRKVETDAFELTRPYFASSQTPDAVKWQAFADFASTHRLIEKRVDVNRLIHRW
ncbi:MAG: ABC transporter substrate-binding protein [Desulfobacterales bacterium]|nr:ABC transporter substrate-binding protein [Desulfobacterales bacterium]